MMQVLFVFVEYCFVCTVCVPVYQWTFVSRVLLLSRMGYNVRVHVGRDGEVQNGHLYYMFPIEDAIFYM